MNEIEIPNAVEKFLRLSVADGAARPRTLSAYRQNISYYLSYCVNNCVSPVFSTHDQVLEYRASLVGRYSRPTIRLRLTAVRLLYRSLQRWGGRQDNPADGVKAPRTQEAEASGMLSRAVSPENIKAILASAPEGRDGAIIRLLVAHGLRVGELSALTLDDLSQDRTHLSIPGKAGKRRTIVLSYRVKADMAAVTPGPMFKRRGGKTLGVRSIERIVNRFLERAGAKRSGQSVHGFRHSHAILAVIGGATSTALAAEMGHSSTRTTDIYSLAASAYLENPTDAVERAIAK